MGYTRRQELCCTEAELIEYKSAVLYDKEILHVTSEDGRSLLFDIIGDGRTPVGQLTAAFYHQGVLNDIKELKEKTQEEEKLLGDHERRLLVLESGVIDGYQTDKTAAYRKTVPANALGYAQLEASGVVSKVVKSSNLWRGVTSFDINAPYEIGVKKAIGTVSLPAGMYYVSGEGSFYGGMMLSDDMGRLVLGESDSRWLTLESTQTVTVYAVVYEDFTVNGSEFESFESVSFAPIGVFSVSYEGEKPSYERPFDPYIKTTVLKSVESKDSAGTNTVTYTVPDNIVELQKSLIYRVGGESGDYIDWVNKRAVKHYKAVDLGDLEWSLRNSATPYWRGSLSGESVGNGSMVLSDVYNETETLNPFPDRSWIAANSQIFIRDSRYTDAAAFKEAVKGTMLYYVSNTPEYTDIDLGEFDGFIVVYPNGTLTFVNDDNAAIPTTVTYQLKEE